MRAKGKLSFLISYVEKHPVLPNWVFLYPVCLLDLHREHFTSELLFTKCVEVLSNTNKQLSDTSRGLVNSTQFQHYLLGDSVRSHRLRTQSHETAPHFGY